jgi:acetyltransferase-like isoleucine patch superfamily enzyme
MIYFRKTEIKLLFQSTKSKMLTLISKIFIACSNFRSNLVNTFYLNIFKVKINKSLQIKGILYLRAHGKIELGENIIINSGFKFNPIGGQTFSSIIIKNKGQLSIGDNVGISNSSIYCVEKIKIGNNVLIGGDCKIYDTDFHSILAINRLKTPEVDIKSKPVLIQNNVFIGTGSIILKGVNIGKNSVIAAGSVVSKDIPNNEIWGGNPIRFLKKI